jgi:imidazolonepropionase-like amidohydrolase
MTHAASPALSVALLVLGGCAQPHPNGSTAQEDATRMAPESEAGASLLHARRVYVDPDSPPLDDAIVAIRDGRIVAVRPAASAPGGQRPALLSKSQCGGGIVMAGFHNNHVHFTEQKWDEAATQPAGDLANHLEHMLTRYGFTTVTDVASDIENTVALRKRIESGEIAGPRILTAGWPQYPRNGIPFYLADLPPEFLAQLRQPQTAVEASRNVIENLGRGADGTKLFVATPQLGGKVARMEPAIARSAVTETHQRGKLVFAHPTDNEGLRSALAAGVDVLVHTTLEHGPTQWDAALVREMVAKGVGVVPTMKLWGYELGKTRLPERVVQLAIGDTVEEVRVFSAAGGQVLFGTDVGYMTDYDPTEEYALLARAGLSMARILATLTTAPAARWEESQRRGRVAAGLDADLVVLEADPAEDARNFAKVRCSFRRGELVYSPRG